MIFRNCCELDTALLCANLPLIDHVSKGVVIADLLGGHLSCLRAIGIDCEMGRAATGPDVEQGPNFMLCGLFDFVNFHQ